MFADDTEKGLQELLNRLEEFCSKWGLSINIEKTKIVIFNKPTCSSNFRIQLPSRTSKEYKYLGITLSDKSLFRETTKVLAKQANNYEALFSLMKKLSKLSYPKPSLMCYLFDMYANLTSY